MPSVELKDSQFALEVEAAEPLHLRDSYLVPLIEALRTMHAQVPLQRFECIQGADGYSYAFVTATGRRWNQTLHVAGATMTMTFNVPDRWALAEFILHRPIRDLIISLIQHYKLVHLTCIWA